jgi:hypothetical protein
LAEKLLHARTVHFIPGEDVISRRSRALATFGSTLEALRYVNAISDEESTQDVVPNIVEVKRWSPA